MTDYNFPEQLPVVARREEIAAAIRDNQVVIVAGETGSGKTTQLGKICMQLGRGQDGMIGHTQPRRIAARTVAQRIAEELKQPLGQTVGYQVRFTDTSSNDTRIKLMTDGILLAEIQRDRLLRKYDTLILDEAHERSLNIDFLLGYLSQLLPKRPDLKLVITSATIDVESFASHFGGAPIIEVSGRTYPVRVEYLDEAEDIPDLNARIGGCIQDIQQRRHGDPGDVLVFLSGEREIRELALHLRRMQLPDLDILPLYARLSAAEQAKVFQGGRKRGIRAVLATNVAETSLSVPGIRYVIDPGYARISRYSPRSKMQRLPVESISQASADQRKGRCGRVSEGVCLRLYSESDFLARDEFTEPEIRRTNLAAVILQMLRLQLGDIARFPFIDPPDSRQVRDGLALLAELGAVDERGQLSKLGRRMADFPVDPRFGRMLLAAADGECLRELLIIVSALSVQDPRERPTEKQQAADEKHRRFQDQRSDFMGWLSLWDYCEEQRQALSKNQWRRRCQKEFLSYTRLLEWRDIHYQLTLACKQQGLKSNTEAATYEAVHKALMSGLLGNLARQHEGSVYVGARNRQLKIFPGSSQFKKRPRWLMAAEIVETSQVYARCVAAVEPEWALPINQELLKHHYFEPRWQGRTGRVMAWEKISLYGLPLVEKQRVHYGPIAPAEAREILVREGLVVGRLRQPPAFLRHNRKLIEELEALESKLRRRDIVVDEQAQVDFYLERLPDNITTINRLKAWLKREKAGSDLLKMTRQQLSLRQTDEALGEQFPDQLHWQDYSLQLSYHFEPGHERDGVSVTIPMGLMNRVPRYRFEWLIPGLLREKCIALFKLLPKAQRKQLVPVPDYVDRVLSHMQVEDRPLTQVLTEKLKELAGVRLQASDWREEELDDYYRMRIEVVDAEGKLLFMGRDLAILIAQCQALPRQRQDESPGESIEKKGLKRWPDQNVAPVLRMRQAGIDIEAYPALVDEGDTVALKLMDYAEQARIAHRRGLVTLARHQCKEQVRYIRKQMLRGNQASLLVAGAGLERDWLLAQLVDGVLNQALFAGGEDPRTEAEYKACIDKGRAELVPVATDYTRLLEQSLETLAQVRKLCGEHRQGPGVAAVKDIEQQTAQLMCEGFMRDTERRWFEQYPRYFKVMLNRLQRLSGQHQKDQQYRQMLEALEKPLHELLADRDDALLSVPPLSHYRWMLEEFRVSLFAQSLGTAMPVSEKRLQEQWQKVSEYLIAHPG